MGFCVRGKGKIAARRCRSGGRVTIATAVSVLGEAVQLMDLSCALVSAFGGAAGCNIGLSIIAFPARASVS